MISETAGVLGHLGLNVPDLAKARRYYGGLMPLVGYDLFFEADDEFAFMPADGKRGTYLFFYPVSASRPYDRDNTIGIQHLAFAVRTRTAVREAHDWAVSQRSEVLHEPREFPEYPQPYFATFWLDPFGIMLEAVCHHDRD
jgi:catechol 2,3-dioxygenase-like lactoylglutathione lyase family enzyme